MLILLIAYLGGVLTILSPCILPVLPFVFARADRPFRSHGLPMLLGMALAFAAVATLAAVGGSWIVTLNEYGRYAALAMLALFGVTLRVQAEGEGGRLVVSVLDNGPGIPPDELDAVLKPFYRVESSRNRSTGGTGLGLAIAHQLAMAMGAELTLHNRPEGGLEARLALAAAPAR